MVHVVPLKEGVFRGVHKGSSDGRPRCDRPLYARREA